MDIAVHRVPDPGSGWFSAYAEVFRADTAERDPDDVPPPDVEIAADLFGLPPDRATLAWVACHDGEPAGLARLATHSAPGEEQQLAEVEVIVVTEQRRRGIGAALLAEVVAAAGELGQTSIIGYPGGDLWAEEGAAFCRRYGLTARQEERCSRVMVAAIDQELVSNWIDDGPANAPGYRIEQWVGPCPDEELLARWCEAAAGMEDMPLDDIDHQPHARQIDEQRAADKSNEQRGYRVYRSLALGLDGSAAGMTVLYVHDARPTIGRQGDTAVLAAHRGHRLGRWLKAANLRQVLAANPELAVIETYNAQSNPWMLDINVAMGFRPHHYYIAHQAPLGDVVAAVSGRRATGRGLRARRGAGRRRGDGQRLTRFRLRS